MSNDQLSGVDLARQALASARLAARNRGEQDNRRAPKHATSPRRTGGRDPLDLGGALKQLVVERGWEIPAAGGNVLGQWKTIATPEAAEHLRAVAFDEHTGRLDIVPDSTNWAFQARLMTPQLIQRANAVAGSNTVHQIRVLPFGSRIPATAAPAELEPAPAPAVRGEVRTREAASPGYHRARSAIGETPESPAQGSARTREDASAGYHEALALVRAGKAQEPSASEPVRTREDASAGYHEALAQIGADTARDRPQTPVRTRETASAGYQVTRRALLDARHRPRPAPATTPAPDTSSAPEPQRQKALRP
ncbi:DciA family protein [Streptomyces sp. NBC_01601]|uniref:DciA family protein n=1 Tax=Streptomyces sp. NBC_01601 TaxID=2975892 RepID=UPI002E2CE54D|nr:DciA family protein [Streptomyces sp. NBC_01601]